MSKSLFRLLQIVMFTVYTGIIGAWVVTGYKAYKLGNGMLAVFAGVIAVVLTCSLDNLFEFSDDLEKEIEE